MEESTVSLALLDGGCCLGGIETMISGSLNTCSVFALEGLGISSLDAAINRLLRTRISRKADCALC